MQCQLQSLPALLLLLQLLTGLRVKLCTENVQDKTGMVSACRHAVAPAVISWRHLHARGCPCMVRVHCCGGTPQTGSGMLSAAPSLMHTTRKRHPDDTRGKLHVNQNVCYRCISIFKLHKLTCRLCFAAAEPVKLARY
jgi:hypothetical protein